MRSRINTALGCVLLMAGSMHAQTFTGKPIYQIEVRRADTLMGKLFVEMFPAIAPNHVRYWDSLVSIHFFDSTAFHRVIPGFMIQGGDPNSRSGPRDTWGQGDPSQGSINAEFSSVSHRRGILSAARTDDPNSANSQFFICVGNPSYLDRKYSVYGRVTSGMEVADSIVMSERDAFDNPIEKISMFVTRIGSNDNLTATPQLLYPTNDTIALPLSKIVFRWIKVADAMLYKLQIATDNDFTQIVIDSGLRQIDSSAGITKFPVGSYFWRLQANNGGHPSDYSEVRRFTVAASSVDGKLDQTFELGKVYPHPVIGTAIIPLQLQKAGRVYLRILDIRGAIARTVIAGEQMSAGDHKISFDRGGLASGIYYYQAEVGGMTSTKEMIIP